MYLYFLLSDSLSWFHLEFLIAWIYVLFPDLCPSLSAGVVSRVVRTGNFSQCRGSSEEPPVMLETTAAVHPGGSGGAVVNEHGRMIGLVTRLFWGNVSCEVLTLLLILVPMFPDILQG